MFSAQPVLIHVTILVGIPKRSKRDVGGFADREEQFGQDDNLVSRKVELLDRLAEDNLGDTIRICL